MKLMRRVRVKTCGAPLSEFEDCSRLLTTAEEIEGGSCEPHLAEQRELEAKMPLIEAAYQAAQDARREAELAEFRARTDEAKALGTRLREVAGLGRGDMLYGVDTFQLTQAGVERLLALLDPDYDG